MTQSTPFRSRVRKVHPAVSSLGFLVSCYFTSNEAPPAARSWFKDSFSVGCRAGVASVIKWTLREMPPKDRREFLEMLRTECRKVRDRRLRRAEAAIAFAASPTLCPPAA